MVKINILYPPPWTVLKLAVCDTPVDTPTFRSRRRSQVAARQPPPMSVPCAGLLQGCRPAGRPADKQSLYAVARRRSPFQAIRPSRLRHVSAPASAVPVRLPCAGRPQLKPGLLRRPAGGCLVENRRLRRRRRRCGLSSLLQRRRRARAVARSPAAGGGAGWPGYYRRPGRFGMPGGRPGPRRSPGRCCSRCVRAGPWFFDGGAGAEVPVDG
jgi:hypothetical protein